MSTPKVQIETITPERARDLLANNVRNRSFKPRHIDYLADELTAGRWELTNDAITIDTEGILTNGQNRLAAIIKADQPAQIMVLDGTTYGAQLASDIGNRRNLRDAMEVAGFSDLTLSAAVVTFLFRMYEPNMTYPQTRTKKYPFAPQIEFAKANADKLKEAVTRAGHVRRSIRFPGSVIGGLWYLQDDLDPQDAAGFWDGITSLAGLEETDPRLVWRKWAERNGGSKNGTSFVPEHHKVALTIKAWNFWRDGTGIQMLTFRAGGVAGERFPELR